MLKFEPTPPQMTFAECRLAVRAAAERVARMTSAAEQATETGASSKPVRQVGSLRRIDALGAVDLAAVINDTAHLAHVRRLVYRRLCN